jgi:DNA polymerase III sliding clamp (beta) subunit (PCNA family)
MDRFKVVSRVATERFPAWEEALPERSTYELRTTKRALLGALDQVSAAMGNRSTPIRLRRVPEGLEIHGENPDAGTLTKVIEASGWKEGAAIGVNPGYLHDAIRFVASEELSSRRDSVTMLAKAARRRGKRITAGDRAALINARRGIGATRSASGTGSGSRRSSDG